MWGPYRHSPDVLCGAPNLSTSIPVATMLNRRFPASEIHLTTLQDGWIKEYNVTFAWVRPNGQHNTTVVPAISFDLIDCKSGVKPHHPFMHTLAVTF